MRLCAAAFLCALSCGTPPEPTQIAAQQQAQRDSMGGLPVASAGVPSTPPRWRVLPCELRYSLRSTNDVDGLDAGSVPGSFADVDFALVPSDSGARLRVVSRHRGGLSASGERLRLEAAQPQVPALELVTDGRAWRTTEAAALWNATYPGVALAAFFPDLPVSQELGALGELQPLRSARDINAFEAARGYATLDPALAEESAEKPIQIAIARWISIAGGRAVELVSAESQGDIDMQGVSTGGWDARWVVREDGVLLHATMEGRATRVGSPTLSASSKSEIRLVASCAGPVMPAFPATSAERATLLLSELGDAAIREDRDALREALAATFVGAHRDAAVDGLVSAVRRFGPDVVAGDGEVRVEVDDDVLDVITSGNVFLKSSASAAAGLQARVTTDVPPRLLGLRVTFGARELLRIDAHTIGGEAVSATTAPHREKVLVSLPWVRAETGRYLLVDEGGRGCALRFDPGGATATSHVVDRWADGMEIGPPITRPLPERERPELPCGDLSVPWSSPSTLYLFDEESQHFDIAVTSYADVDELRASGSGSGSAWVYLSARWGQLPWNARAERAALRAARQR